MPIYYPDILQTNNPNNAIADSDTIRGGGKVVANLAALYSISTGPGNGKYDQLKEHVTRVWVTDQQKTYVLKDITQVSNADGWSIDASGTTIETTDGIESTETDGVITLGLGNITPDSVTTSGNITAAAITKNGGTSSQFLKADGSVDDGEYVTAEDFKHLYPANKLTSLDDVGLQAFITSVGDNSSTIVIDRLLTITSNISIPNNISLKILFGCGFYINTGFILTINSKLDASNNQIFYGDGNVILGQTKLIVDWFGAKTDLRVVNDGITTASGTSVSSSSANFTHNDIGKILSVWSVDAYGKVSYGSGHIIQTVNSTTSVTLSTAPSQSITGATFNIATDSYAAFRKAQAVLPNGGDFELLRGTYCLSHGIDLFPSNTRIFGYNKKDTTIQFLPIGTNEAFLNTNTSSRLDRDYPKNSPSTLYTYSNATRKGDMFIDLKDPSWSANFAIGDIIFIKNGANYYNQAYGEQNEITRISGARLYLKNPLSKEMSTGFTQYYGITNTDFIQPAVGSTVTVTGTNMPYSSEIGLAVSIGENIYIVQNGSTATSSILLNAGRGSADPGTIIPSGSRISTSRILYKSTRSRNITIENLTLLSSPYNTVRLLRTDNSYGTTIRDTGILIHPLTPSINNVAIWFTDNACDNLFERVDFTSNYLFSSQISTSATRSKYINCKFSNAVIEPSEFATDCRFIDCDFYYNRAADETNVSTPSYNPISIGNTCSNISFIGGTIRVTSESTLNPFKGIFYSGDIQGFDLIRDAELFSVENVNIESINVGAIWYFSGAGVCKFNNNKFFSKNIDSLGGYLRSGGNSQSYGNYLEFVGNSVVLDHNTSASNPLVYLQGFIRFESNNFEFRNPSGFDINAYLKATLRMGLLVDGDKIIFRNNTFKNFPIIQNWFLNDNSTLNNKLDIANNRFINNQIKVSSSVRLSKNFVLTLKNDNNGLLGSSMGYISKSTWETDLKIYTDLVAANGGVLSSNNISAANFVIKALYANNLIRKVKYLNIHQGDALAALVPLYGYDLGGNRPDIRTELYAQMYNGMALSNYDAINGWINDGTGKCLSLLASLDVDVTDMSLMVQITKAETNVGWYLGFGGTLGAMGTVTGNVLYYLGNSNIKTSYVPSVGFFLCSKNATLQLNVLDTINYPNIINNVSGAFVGSNYTDPLRKLATHGYDTVASSTSNAGIGATGVFSTLTQTEALILRDIIQQAMSMIGRSTQIASGNVVSTDLSNPTSQVSSLTAFQI